VRESPRAALQSLTSALALAHPLQWYETIHFDTIPRILQPAHPAGLAVRYPLRRSAMRKLMLVTAFVLVGCTRPAQPPGAGLARELAGRVAGPPQTCVNTFPNQNLRVIDASTLAYGYGRTVYVNRLGGPCPGLEPLSTVIIQSQGSQYCRGDRIQGREPSSIIAGPMCNLSDWIPYRTP
jgi:hypothetical protein